MKFTLSCGVLICSVLAVPVTASGQSNISAPVMAEAPPWQPSKIVMFGDSLSDSHGDSFRPPDLAYSTFNLLRTLRGELVTLPDGQVRRPMELDTLIGHRSTIANIRANFDLLAKEVRQEGLERRYLGRLLSNFEAVALNLLGDLVTGVLQALDRAEDRIDEGVLPLLKRAQIWLDQWVPRAGANTVTGKLLVSLEKKLIYVANFIERDFSDAVLDFGDDRLIEITSRFKDAIPLIPNPDYYVQGKWTAGAMGKVWVEYLHRMMSFGSHQVALDNRAMAGSWTLCASDKMEALHIIDDLTSGMMAGATLFFQGSMIPPCEGLVVQSYLNERRNIFLQAHGRTPNFGEPIIESDTLVVFFNSANDFLNKWSDPDDVAQEMARDIWMTLDAGAQRVAVVLLPDISDTPRFHPDRSQGKSAEALAISSLIQRYNTSLRMRLNLLREEFHGANGYQVVTIDGDRMFKLLQADPRWDLERPILDIAVPGVDVVSTEGAPVGNNFINTELKKNQGFRDTFGIRGANVIAPGNVPFFADTVHPSADAHYAIAVAACRTMSEDFNIPCNPDNYTEAMALAEAQQ
ncbi:SGNH/GDSL hydrolase family protein [Parendozoicomonas haliclonae]|uniref:SGNH hydrolase-type esterase domain-containing protein n=1 Tax=Parendozoicomonas haliclonae TaxID=1960125 RepID=A0A1X7AFD5_9GAMM|nr:SGNH/GDSL hydrolase family protein [Parendozoicomonas haliclonae]SMA37406.1 hypothetical protein EHSB41UT_00732 [Parendozoicomonas haliclonae]